MKRRYMVGFVLVLLLLFAVTMVPTTTADLTQVQQVPAIAPAVTAAVPGFSSQVVAPSFAVLTGWQQEVAVAAQPYVPVTRPGGDQLTTFVAANPGVTGNGTSPQFSSYLLPVLGVVGLGWYGATRLKKGPTTRTTKQQTTGHTHSQKTDSYDETHSPGTTTIA